MNWRDILKVMAPNLQSVNMMTALRHDAEDKPDTMTGAGKPESDDSRCRDRLQQFFNDLDALVKSEPDWYLDTHAGGLTLTEEAFPEELCCEILERLASSRSTTQDNVGFHYRKRNLSSVGGVIHMWMLNDVYREDIPMDWVRCALFFGGDESKPLDSPESFLVELEQLPKEQQVTRKDRPPVDTNFWDDDYFVSSRKQRYENWVKFRKKILGILP